MNVLNDPQWDTPTVLDFIGKLIDLLGFSLGLGTALLAYWQYEQNRKKEQSALLREKEKSQEQAQKELEQRKAEALHRQEEFRWKQAEMSKLVMDEIFSDKASVAAMNMLDWSGRSYDIEGEKKTIKKEKVLLGLRTQNLTFDPTERFIRDCFDRFFEHLRRLNHFVDIKLIHFDDIDAPIRYYIDKLLHPDEKDVYRQFLKIYGYNGVLDFINRFQ